MRMKRVTNNPVMFMYVIPVRTGTRCLLDDDVAEPPLLNICKYFQSSHMHIRTRAAQRMLIACHICLSIHPQHLREADSLLERFGAGSWLRHFLYSRLATEELAEVHAKIYGGMAHVRENIIQQLHIKIRSLTSQHKYEQLIQNHSELIMSVACPN